MGGSGESLPVGLFFGSFNPIHNGHVGIARALLEGGWCREVWFVVSPRNPFKREEGLLPEEERLAIVEAAIAGERGMRACDAEFDMPRPSYTADTLRRLMAARPGERFALVMGADNVARFTGWKDYRWIEGHVPIFVYPRRDARVELPPEMGATLVDAPLFPLSATEIRGRLRRGEDVSAYVPAGALPLVAAAYGKR